MWIVGDEMLKGRAQGGRQSVWVEGGEEADGEVESEG